MRTYADMAQALDIPYCRGLRNGRYCHLGDHKVGFVTDHEGATVHFSDRRKTYADTHTFLKLAAIAYDPTTYEDPPWRRVYRTGQLARELGARLRTRVPARFWSADKAFVLAGVAGLSNEVPMRKQAFDWARRKGRDLSPKPVR